MTAAFERERRFDLAVAARKLDLSPRTLREWIRTGLLRAQRKNPRSAQSPWMVTESEINRIESERLGGGDTVRHGRPESA